MYHKECIDSHGFGCTSCLRLRLLQAHRLLEYLLQSLHLRIQCIQSLHDHIAVR